ncbi:28 kDa heat- and acid-stable phosphoprotein-like isoform X2 [Sesamum indicum]|uniref:28 kDa heat- and acid-stable phosphoprotein-like isoform X2 n=1 Tax=Sesamum indicum TaxID=4182 RepID=A0A8M8V529_SESIN|nr:28 kDa heat- and acid-stable phosphoprotein-like isoform X2 [Sesamum indicum]
MGRGKFKGKPTGRRQFSTPEQMMSGTSASRPRTFKKEEAEVEEDERSDEESVEESEDETEKTKGTKGVIQIENPNLAKPKNLKARDADLIWLSVLLREEIERQRAHERYMRLQEQGKTEQARKDLGTILESAVGIVTFVTMLQQLLPLFVRAIGSYTAAERGSCQETRRGESCQRTEEDGSSQMILTCSKEWGSIKLFHTFYYNFLSFTPTRFVLLF